MLKLPPAYQATAENITKAKKIISEMEAIGGTDIYTALRTASKVIREGIKSEKLPKPILIFLSDGDATVGVKDASNIVSMAKQTIYKKSKAPIFTLAFGSDADQEFLTKISLETSGFMQKIYEADDAALQLRDFYKTISTPLLKNIQFNYPIYQEGNTTAEKMITNNKFDIMFKGGELVVSGKMSNNPVDEGFNVSGTSNKGPINFRPKIIQDPADTNKLERIQAYMTIKELFNQAKKENSWDKPKRQRALEMALKVRF